MPTSQPRKPRRPANTAKKTSTAKKPSPVDTLLSPKPTPPDSTPPVHWLLVTVATTGPSSSLRVAVWRKLRSLGALYLQQSACLLPDHPDTASAVARLLDRVRRGGGEGRLLHLTLSHADEKAVIEAFQAERSDEYHEVCDRTPAFLDEIAKEWARGRTTYAEVEESEADLDRLRTWLNKIIARDYFGAPGRAEADAELQRCAAALAEFEAAALQADAPPATPAGTARRLRAIGD